MGEMNSGKILGLYRQIRDVLTQARARAWQAVNFEMVACYWEIGRLIVEEEQRGAARADYGKRLIRDLSKRLSKEFGKGFEKRNLWFIRSFYLAYPKVNALRSELTWTHYRILLRVETSEARAFYEAEAVNALWSTRELERQINSLLFQRLALSRDKAGVMALAAKGHEINEPGELVKDPYVLEFTGIRQDEHFLEKDLESALISKLRQFLLELGKGFSLGIVLCSDKNDAVVRYTLPEGNDQIYASRYKLYLPTEKELATELLRERKALEMEAALAGKTRKRRTRKGEV